MALDQDYSFFVTGLNPYEGTASEHSTYRLAGRPSAVSALIEMSEYRTGNRLGLSWEAPADGGSQILSYTLVRVQENMNDEVVYHGSSTSVILDNLKPGTDYSYRIVVANLVGNSESSNLFTYEMVEAPSQP